MIAAGCSLIVVALMMHWEGTECQDTCFKNSWYIFSKWGESWEKNRQACKDQGGDLVSIETEGECHFINDEIQKRSSWNTSAWHIGLCKKDTVWTWESGKQLNISKWRDIVATLSGHRAEITKSGSLNSITKKDSRAFICEMPQECPNISFQNSWYIFTEKGEGWDRNRDICQSQRGDLVSIETEEEWNFTNDQIQNRSTESNGPCDYAGCHYGHWDTWYIGLERKGKNWTWVNGKLMNMSKWTERSKCGGTVAYICKQSIDGEQGLFSDIHGSKKLAYICEIPKETSLPSESIRPQPFWSSLSPSLPDPPSHLLSLLHLPSQLLSKFPSQSSSQLASQSPLHSTSQLPSLSLWPSTSQAPSQSPSQSPLQWTLQSTAEASLPSESLKLQPTPSPPLWSTSLTLRSLSQALSLSLQSPSQSLQSLSQSLSLTSPRLPSKSQSPSLLQLPSQSSSQLPLLHPPFHSLLTSLSPSHSLLPSTSSLPLQWKIIEKLAAECVSKLGRIDITNNSSLEEAIRVLDVFITRIKNITKAPDSASEEIETSRKSAFKVAVAFEEFALNYSKVHLIGARSSQVIDSNKMVLGIQKAYHQNASDFHLWDQELQASIYVLSTNFAKSVSLVVGIMHKDLHELLDMDQPIRNDAGKATRYLNSRIMAVAMDPKPNKLEANVILKFRNLRVDGRKKTCVFWRGFNKSSEGFSGRGCHVVASQSNSEETVCSCNHLTHFAVLLDYNGSSELTEEDETLLEIITYVGLSLSIMGIILTVILYSFLTDVHQPLSQIRLSLSVALGAGQFIFLVGINATKNKASCITAAAFMQYFLMASFCWMLVEGFYLYLFVVKVYNITEKMHMYHVMSWGLPIVMVSISLCIAAGKDGIESFTSDKYCWLSYTNNLIWIFAAFMAFVEVLNILILVRVIKEMTTLVQPLGEDNHIKQIRLGFKTCAVMIPLMGITWLFGLLSPWHKAFAYFFTIFNSTQGFLIFFFHCVRNSQIRERLKRRMNAIFPSSEVGNSARKNSRVNASDAGEIQAVEMQSFDA